MKEYLHENRNRKELEKLNREAEVVTPQYLEAVRRGSSYCDLCERWILTDWAIFFQSNTSNHTAIRWDEIKIMKTEDFPNYAMLYGADKEIPLPNPDADLPFLNRFLDLVEKHSVPISPILLNAYSRSRLKKALEITGKLPTAKRKMRPFHLACFAVLAGIASLCFSFPQESIPCIIHGFFTATPLLFGLYLYCNKKYVQESEKVFRRINLLVSMISRRERKHLKQLVLEISERKAENEPLAKERKQQEYQEHLYKILQRTPRKVHKSLHHTRFSETCKLFWLFYLYSGYLLYQILPIAILYRQEALHFLFPFLRDFSLANVFFSFLILWFGSLPVIVLVFLTSLNIPRILKTEEVLRNGIAARGKVHAAFANCCEVEIHQDLPRIQISQHAKRDAEVVLIYTPAMLQHDQIGLIIDPPSSIVYNENERQFEAKANLIKERILWSIIVLETILWGVAIGFMVL